MSQSVNNRRNWWITNDPQIEEAGEKRYGDDWYKTRELSHSTQKEPPPTQARESADGRRLTDRRTKRLERKDTEITKK